MLGVRLLMRGLGLRMMKIPNQLVNKKKGNIAMATKVLTLSSPNTCKRIILTNCKR